MTASSAPTKVVVSGAAGRLGGRIVQLAARSPKIDLVGLVVREGSEAEGQTLAALHPGAAHTPAGRLQATSALSPPEGAVLIETAPPPGALAHLEQARDLNLPVVLATTGFRAADTGTLDRVADAVPLLVAPNLSLGVNVLLDLVARASKALAAYDLEVLELHHRRKRDAPSGTAWALARAAADARGMDDLDRAAIFARAGDVGPRSDAEIGMFAIRGGDIVGEHTVYFVGEHERVEITHRAATRDAFAEGALAAATFLSTQTPGRYRMTDVLGLA